MNKIVRAICSSLLVLVGVSGSRPSHAGSTVADTSVSYLDSIKRRIVANWEPMDFALHPHGLNAPTYVVVHPWICFNINAEGEVRDLSLMRTTGVKALDLAAEDAILGCSPLPAPPSNVLKDGKLRCLVVFSSLKREYLDTEKVPRSYHCITYANSDMGDEAIMTIHGIPADALVRYPTAIKAEDIHATGNVRDLDLNDGENLLRDIRSKWSLFFRLHPNASKEELLAERDKIDNWYKLKKSSNDARLIQEVNEYSASEKAQQ